MKAQYTKNQLKSHSKNNLNTKVMIYINDVINICICIYIYIYTIKKSLFQITDLQTNPFKIALPKSGPIYNTQHLFNLSQHSISIDIAEPGIIHEY